MKRRWLALALSGLSWLAYVGSTSYLAKQDLIGALLVRHQPGAALLTAAVLGLRLFLILLAPGWLLWLAVAEAERRLSR